MTAAADLAPGLERIRARFLEMLDERLTEMERLSKDPSRESLLASQLILHKIAGSAGTLGLADLGERARICENQIISHLDSGAPRLRRVYRSLGRFAAEAEGLRRPAA